MQTFRASTSTKQWVKIWFSKDPNHFITEKNRARLEHFLEENPERTLSLVYSSKLLNETGLTELNTLKKNKANLLLIDVDDSSFSEQLRDDEKTLFNYALQELRYCQLDQGGNLGAASDIIRLLSPCYRHGIYTDFDVYLNPHGLLETYIGLYGFYCPERNNDALVILDSSDRLLQYLQQTIPANYGKFLKATQDRIQNAATGTSTPEKEFYRLLSEKYCQQQQHKTPRLFQFSSKSKTDVYRVAQLRKMATDIAREHADNPNIVSEAKRFLIDSVCNITGPGIYPDKDFDKEKRTLRALIPETPADKKNAVESASSEFSVRNVSDGEMAVNAASTRFSAGITNLIPSPQSKDKPLGLQIATQNNPWAWQYIPKDADSRIGELYSDENDLSWMPSLSTEKKPTPSPRQGS